MSDGWTQARVRDVAALCLGKMLDQAKNRGSFRPYLRNINVRWGSFDLHDLQEMRFEDHEVERYTLREGDLVMCEGGEPGRCAVWSRPDPIFIQKALHRIRCIEPILPHFLAYQFQLLAQLGALASHFTGSTIKHLPGNRLAEVAVRFPAVAEQQRIVDALDAYLTKVDAAVTGLERVQANLKRYRASVLKAAVEGRLVPTEAELARQEGRDYEPASVLLEHILVERRRRWEQAELAKMKAKGKPPKDDMWKAKYKEPAQPDTEGLPELPEGWCWSSIGECFDVEVGATPSRAKPDYWGGEIAWVSSGEVAFCRIKSTEETITQAGLDNSSTRINPPGSVMIGMIGEGRTRGQVAMLDISACNNQNCAAIWVSKTDVVPEYIYYYLMGQYEATRKRGSGNNQPALNKTRVSAIPVPLPPVAEQARIVDRIEELVSIVEETSASMATGAVRASRLRQAILKWAFEGKLVDQDPNDEPAAELLARIRAERDAQDHAPKTRTPRKARAGRRKAR